MKWLEKLFKINRPKSASMKGWAEWEANYKASHPILHWVTEELPFYTYTPIRMYQEWEWKTRNRFFLKSYRVETDLDKWEYHDKGKIMFHASFQLLTDYVEIDLARKYEKWYDKERRFERDFAYGLEMLHETIRHNPDMKELSEVEPLYRWWKARASKEDCYKKFDEYLEGKPLWELGGNSVYRQMMKEALECEEKCRQEDEEMLIRLVRIRGCLWT